MCNKRKKVSKSGRLMMFAPRGEVIHQNLSTSYTDIPVLLAGLKSEGFTGTMEVSAAGMRGVIFLDRGETMNAEAEHVPDGKRFTGSEAKERLLALAGESDGTVGVYRFSPDQIAFLAGTLKAEMVFKGLSTDFIWLDKLVAKLKDDRHDGYIELLTKAGQALGALFLRGGEVSDLFVASESGISFFFDQKSVSAFVDGAKQQGALINVYKRITGEDRSAQPVAEKAAAPAEESVASDPPALQQQGESKEDLRRILGALQEVLVRIERVADGLSRQGSFARAFKRALTEKSELYPFLDPAQTQFDYQNETLLFTGDVDLGTFARGVGECLNLAVSNLKKEFPKNMVLPVGLKSEIESSFQAYQETVRRLGVDSIPPLFLQ
jgi:hypothetical protein